MFIRSCITGIVETPFCTHCCLRSQVFSGSLDNFSEHVLDIFCSTVTDSVRWFSFLSALRSLHSCLTSSGQIIFSLHRWVVLAFVNQQGILRAFPTYHHIANQYSPKVNEAHCGGCECFFSDTFWVWELSSVSACALAKCSEPFLPPLVWTGRCSVISLRQILAAVVDVMTWLQPFLTVVVHRSKITEPD